MKENTDSCQDSAVSELNEEPLISEIEIQHRTVELARRIASDINSDEIVIISVLKGAFMFTADLIRRLAKYMHYIQLDFIRAKSYGDSTKSSGNLIIETDTTIDLAGKCVLIVDDIIDTGNTLSKLTVHLRDKGAGEIKTCVLLDKPSRREVVFKPDYVGFDIPNHFVVGYGLDFAEKYRSLPYITCVQESENECK